MIQAIQDTNIGMIRGDTLALGVELLDDSGQALTDDLTAAYFSCKSDPENTAYSFQKTLSNGISKVETGKYQIRVAPEDTENLEPGTYYYDFEFQIGDDVYTPLIGKLVIDIDITREI